MSSPDQPIGQRLCADPSAEPDARPAFRVASFGLGAKLQRMAEIVFRHARHNPYRFVPVTSRGPEAFDLALIDMTAKGGADVARTLQGLPQARAIIKVGRRGDPRRGACDDVLLQRFALNLLGALNRAVEQCLLGPRQSALDASNAALRVLSGFGAEQVLGRRARVLFIDESPTVRRQVIMALGAMGLDAEGVSSMAEARDTLALRPYELTLIEIDSADRSGLGLVKDIKRDPRLRQMPVVALTRRGALWDKLRGGLAGCDAYLVKPVSTQVLRETVGRAIQHSLALKSETGALSEVSARLDLSPA